jgi:hypothetical protein
MATLSQTDGDRRETIAEVITAELDRQAHEGAHRIDVPALAEAIESVIVPEADTPPDEGKRPADLNATNDD